LRADWIFSAPFETRPIDVGRPSETAPAPLLNEIEQEEETALLRSMIEGFAHAAAASDKPA
jgi:hypothetical protein